MSKICKNCKNEINSDAKYCPICKKKQGGLPKWAIVITVIFAIIVLAMAFSGDTDDTNTNDNNATNNSTNNQSNQKVEKFSYTVDNTTRDTFAYYIEGTVTNNKDKDYSYVSIEFVCYDSDGNNLGTAMDNTNNLLGKQTWKYKAMFIGSDQENVDHCDYHEVSGW